MQYGFYNLDCFEGAKKHIADCSVDLMACDVPFGIREASFSKHYNRDDLTIGGYVEAPADYARFSNDWIGEAKRILKDNGALWVISGWTNLRHVLNAIDAHGMHLRNHVVWKYNFGVYTRRKFVSAHYHLLYVLKSHRAKPTFNTTCRFSPEDRTGEGNSALYRDLEDVWVITKEYQRGTIKNVNKLPTELVRKIMQYSSNPGDLVCDFFLGNGTTAFVARELGRSCIGFELNPAAYKHFSERFDEVDRGVAA